MRKKIVIIDGQQMVAKNLILHLEKEYDFFWSATGREGLALVGKENPDLLITDLTFPDLTGLKIIEAIHHNNMNIPIIVTTGEQNRSKLDAIRRSGVFQIIKKPYNMESLVQELKLIMHHEKFSESQELDLDKELEAREKNMGIKTSDNNKSAIDGYHKAKEKLEQTLKYMALDKKLYGKIPEKQLELYKRAVKLVERINRKIKF